MYWYKKTMFFPLASVVMVQVLVNFCGSTVHGFSSVAFGHRPHRGRTTALQYTESVIPPVPPVDVSGGVVTVRPTTRRRTSRDRFIEKNYNNNDVAASKSRRPTKRTGLTTASTTIVKSMQDFQKTVLQEQESMVIVRFMASWCPGCKATTPAYHRLMRKLEKSLSNDESTTTTATGKQRKIKFVDCPLENEEATKVFHDMFGITTIPFVQIYHPLVGLVEEQHVTRRNFFDFETMLTSYVDGECPVVL